MARQPKMLWGRQNPYYFEESKRASSAPLDGTVQGAKNDFHFKVNDFVLHDDEEIIDYDEDGIDDKEKIISQRTVKNDAPESETTKQYCFESSTWMAHNCGIPNVMMSTIHGSYLYGTAREGSHPTFYIVSDSDINMNLSIDNRELIIVGYDQFLELLTSDDLTAIEARYSPYCVFTSSKNRDKIYRFDMEESQIANIIESKILDETNKENPNNELLHRLSISYKSASNDEYTPVIKDLS